MGSTGIHVDDIIYTLMYVYMLAYTRVCAHTHNTQLYTPHLCFPVIGIAGTLYPHYVSEV